MYSVAIAGSTSRTAQCAQALLTDGRFSISWILTPEPKPIGRKQILTKNPLHLWAEEKNIPIVLIKNKIDEQIKQEVESYLLALNSALDFILVVDFGYIVPAWLLKLPKIAPLNIHPSALPKWRGSSPGQFVLLNGEIESAVTLMIMNDQLDQGPIIYQEKFQVEPNWTQTEYYQHSFNLICQKFPQKMVDLAEQKIIPSPQPEESPTPVAKKLTKEDSFIDWAELVKALTLNSYLLSPQIERATRAYLPWPSLWTIIPTGKGPKRMKILKSHLDKNKLVLDQVQIEGLQPTTWNEVKNLVSNT